MFNKGTSLIEQKIGIDIRHFSKASAWLGSAQIIQAIFGIITSVLLARLTSKEIVGNFLLITTLSTYAALLIAPGVNLSLTHAVAHGKEGTFRTIIYYVIRQSLIVMPLIITLAIAAWLFGMTNLGMGLLAVGIFLPFICNPLLWEDFLIAKEKFHTAAIRQILRMAGASIPFWIILYFFPHAFWIIIFGYFGLYSICTIFFTWLALRSASNNIVDGDAINYSKHISAVRIINEAGGQLEQVVLGIFVSPSLLAIYGMSINYVVQLQLILQQISNVALARLTKLGKVPIRIWLIFLSIGAAIALPAWFIIDDAVILFLGSAYDESAQLSRIAAFSIVFFILSIMFQRWLILHKKKKEILFTSIIKILVYWGMQLYGYFTFGITGLVIAFALQPLVTLLVGGGVNKLMISDK